MGVGDERAWHNCPLERILLSKGETALKIMLYKNVILKANGFNLE